MMLDWLMVKLLMMDELKYAYMGFGALYVTTDGTTEMLKLCVDSCSMMDVSQYHSNRNPSFMRNLLSNY